MAYNNSVPSSSYQGGQNYQQLQTDPDIQSSYETIPAKTTAGLHQADSDLNNRTQYAPRTATASATNTDPGAMTASNSSSGGVVGGSSTGAPAVPSPATRSKYSREHSSYNPATGTEYTPRHPKEQTTAGTAETSGSTASASGSRGDGIGQSIKGTLAGIHVGFIIIAHLFIHSSQIPC